MKSLTRTLIIALTLVGLLSACTMGAQPTAPVDNAAAISTAVAGTQQSSALAQATVNSVVLTAMPATPTPGPTVEYVSMTEEELAALIDDAVAEAVAATEQTTTAVVYTTSDTAMTTEEVTYVYDYYYYADYYVEYAEDLLNEYYTLYADLAYEMIAELETIESQINELNTTLTSIDSSLQQISTTLQQGLEVATETIDQLNQTAQQAQARAAELKTQSQDMMAVLQSDQQARLDQMAQIQPNNIPTDKLAALQTGFQFIDEAKLAMGDNKMSRDELMNLAQLGANAQAGFQKFGGAAGGQLPGLPNGGPDLNQFSAKFGEITQQFARGQMPQARSGLDGFEHSLGQRPSGGPSLPGGGGGPSRPGRP